MTSKERVRSALLHKQPDRVPVNFEAVITVKENLCKKYGYSETDKIYDKFEIDIREVLPKYIGKPFKTWKQGLDTYTTVHYGCTFVTHWSGKEYHEVVAKYPFNDATTIDDIDKFNWISPDDFDYENIKIQCNKIKDKAIIFGHEGPFQLSTFLMNTDDLLVKMAIEPEVAKKLYNRFVQFELEYYERVLIAGGGQIDILRPHDDYGTQNSMLFSIDMWKDFFEENTIKLVNLAHKYGAFYQQHSCGAISSIIPNLISCKVDSLEPIQKVKGMEIDILKKKYGDKLCLHGGIDTQKLLPNGNVKDVEKEVEYFIKTANINGGYILMGSQGYEADIPLENIEAIYKANRN